MMSGASGPTPAPICLHRTSFRKARLLLTLLAGLGFPKPFYNPSEHVQGAAINRGGHCFRFYVSETSVHLQVPSERSFQIFGTHVAMYQVSDEVSMYRGRSNTSFRSNMQLSNRIVSL